ncbi:hypothetical protein T439DRAFT_381416 [Meredithblackwellia eburnea MCA 4105]
MSSSLEKLQHALQAAALVQNQRLLASPATSDDTNGTGATGSSEEPGTATRSLIASVLASRKSSPSIPSSNKLQSLLNQERVVHSQASNSPRGMAESVVLSDSPPLAYPSAAHSQAPASLKAQAPLAAPPSSSGTESWSEIALPTCPLEDLVKNDNDRGDLVSPLEGDQLEAIDGDAGREGGDEDNSSFVEQSIPMTDEQLEEGLSFSVTRSSEHFRRWMSDMIANAREGNASSAGDYHDGFRVFERSTPGSQSGVPSSAGYGDEDAHARTESGFASIDLQGAPRSEAVSVPASSQVLEPTEVISIKLEQDDLVAAKLVEGQQVKIESDLPALKKEENEEINDGENSESSKSSDSAQCFKTASPSGGWRIAAIVLGATLVANLGHQHRHMILALLALVRPVLLRLRNGIVRIPDQSPSVPVVLIENVTANIFEEPISIGQPLGILVPVSAVLALVLVVLSGLSIAFRSTAVPEKSTNNVRFLVPSKEGGLTDTQGTSEKNHQYLTEGITRYQQGHLNRAATFFELANQLAKSPKDKATASEWLGRTRHRQARQEKSPRLMHAAITCFERAVRLDGASASPRASWGRALFLLHDYAAAEKVLLGAIRRDDSLSYAHEFLGKARIALGKYDEAFVSLRKAVELDPFAYNVLAFLGEQLHVRLQANADAKEMLTRALKLRYDLPAAHARLGAIAVEEEDMATAHRRWTSALALRDRAGGRLDEDVECLPSSVSLVQSTCPFLNLFFCVAPTDRDQRIRILRRALAHGVSSGHCVSNADVGAEDQQKGSHYSLVRVLLAINQRRSQLRSERGTGLADLRMLDHELKLRTDSHDGSAWLVTNARGLYSLVLLGLGKTKLAESQYAAFWKDVGVSGTPEQIEDEESRRWKFVALAFFELKGQ